MSTKKATKPLEFVVPRHPNAQVHQLIMKRLKAMTPEEIFQTSVKAGIHKKSGKLTKRYASRASDSHQ